MIVNSVSQWAWLILTTFALWIYDTRAGAVLTMVTSITPFHMLQVFPLTIVPTVILIKLVDMISPAQYDIVVLQLTRSFGITLIDFFQGFGILIALAFPFARVYTHWKRGSKLGDLVLISEQQEHYCSHCRGSIRGSQRIPKEPFNPA